MKHLKILSFLFSLYVLTSPIVKGQTKDSERQTRNITAFTRLFGYIRYFHPSDETQEIDWERFAIYGCHYVKDAPDDDQLIRELRDLFSPLAPTARIFRGKDAVQFDVSTITPKRLQGYTATSWQYTSTSMRLSSDFQRPPHSTARLNRSSWATIPEHYDTGGVGMVSHVLPAMYNGGQFTFTAKMKLFSENSGIGQLGFTSINTEGQNTYSDTVHTGKDSGWKEYNVSGTINERSQQFYIGIVLSGKGQLWVKDLELSAVKDGHTYAIPISNGNFSQAEASGSPTGWLRQPYNNYQYRIENNSLEISYVDSITLSRRPDQPIYEYKTFVGEYIRKPLVPGIMCIVPLALYGNEDHTYPTVKDSVLSHLKDDVKQATRGELTADSLDVRLGDIVLCWNIYRHFSPFWPEADQTPDQVLQDAIARAFRNKTASDFFQTLRLLCVPLNDGHIFPSFARDSTVYGMAGIIFTIAEGSIVVKEVLDTAFHKKIRPGDLVDSINGQTAWEVLKEEEKYISGSPQGKRSVALRKLSFGYPWSKLHLTLQRGTLIYRETLFKTGWMNYWHNMSNPLPASGTEVADKIYYINLLEPAENVAPLMEKLADAKAVIFDLRGYPSYDLFQMIITHFLDSPKTSPPILYEPLIVYPDFEKVKFPLSSLEVHPQAPRITCKAYFLSNAAVGSHPEYFLAFVKAYKLGTVIGEPTAGVDGSINGFTLPGGFGLSFTGMKVAPMPGTTSHLQGVLPDITVGPTISSLAAGKDQIFEWALKIAKDETR
ncbi:MAG TPA: S41 family peptidase [Puia sp.]|nr:S41 family peptidase [Puia sp.]